MSATNNPQPIVHFVGSIPLADAETVFRTLSAAAGRYLKRLARRRDRHPQDLDHAFCKTSSPRTRRSRWRPTCRRSNSSSGTASCSARSRALRIKPGATPDPATFETGYAEMAIEILGSCSTVCSEPGVIPAGRQIPDLAADPDRADLQQHGARRSTGLLPALTRI